jgi:hypothetical protein
MDCINNFTYYIGNFTVHAKFGAEKIQIRKSYSRSIIIKGFSVMNQIVECIHSYILIPITNLQPITI